MKLKSLVLLISCHFAFTLLSQNEAYLAKSYVSINGDTLLYRELTPQKIDTNAKYPLVLFLHGAGERGTDNNKQLTHGSMMFSNPVNQEKYACYAVFPQCPPDKYWPTPNRPDNFNSKEPFPSNAEISQPLALTKELLDKLTEEYPIDKNRIYVIGLSMGGMGTFDIVCRFPEYFAAAVPICGGINIERLDNFRTNTKFRIFHGDADSVVPVRFSREAYVKLKEEGNSVEYIEFPGVNHDSWNPAFNQHDFFSWIFKQSK